MSRVRGRVAQSRRIACLVVAGLLAGKQARGQDHGRTLDDFLVRTIGLKASQLAALSRGDVVGKVLPTADDRDVAVFAAVHVDVPRSFFVERQRDFTHALRTPTRSEVRLFGTPAADSDVQALNITDDDLQTLRDCRPNDCNFKLPATDMDSLRALIDVSAPDARSRVAAYARQLIVDYVNDYRQRGNTAMLVYNDLGSVRSSDALAALLRDSSSVIQAVPSLGRHVMNYPRDTLPGATDVIFWSIDALPHVRATLRITHETVYSPPDLQGTTILASKQIYADHYFEAGLELLTVIDGTAGTPTSSGITLVAVRRYRFDHLPSGGLLDLRGHVVSGLQDNAVSDLKRLKADSEAAFRAKGGG